MSGASIILVGGEVTLDSGVTVDSRQPLAGDEWDFVLREAIATSEGWWLFVKSLVDKILDETSVDAWALAWANKTLRRPRADGGLTQVRIAEVLQSADQLLRYAGKAGQIQAVESPAKYRILPYLLRFEHLKVGEPPTVFVGSLHETYEDGTDIVGQRPLDVVLSRWPNTIVVLPHTPIVEAKARAILRTDVARHPVSVGLAERTHATESKRYVEARERLTDLRKSRPYALAHDFHVTFWIDRGQLQDAAELDAALSFIRARYDLSFGLWDLARDRVLRNSLLPKSQIKELGSMPVAMPAEVHEAARAKAAERESAGAREKEARQRHHAAIWPNLSRAGWQKVNKGYSFPAGPEASRFPGAPPRPVVFVALQLTKRQAVLNLFEQARSGRTEAFLQAHAEDIVAVTGEPPEPRTQTIWRIPGLGWEGDVARWKSQLPIVQRLVDVLVPLLGPLADAAAADARRAIESRGPLFETSLPPQPPQPKRSL